MLQEFIDSLNLQQLTTEIVEFLPHLAIAIALLVAVYILMTVSSVWLKEALRSADFDPVLITLLVDNLYRCAIILLALIMAVDQIGVNVTTALAGLGVVILRSWTLQKIRESSDRYRSKETNTDTRTPCPAL